MSEKPALLDDAMIGEFMDRIQRTINEASVVIHAGELPQEALDALVEAKQEMVDIFQRLHSALKELEG